MKKRRLPIFAFIVALCVAAIAPWAFSAPQLYRDSVLRAKPSFLSASLGTVKRGTSVKFLGESGGWQRIRTGGRQGWLPESAFQAPTALKSGERLSDAAASPGIVTLAGKGLDQNSEDAARKSTVYNFEAVDLMESYVIPQGDREEFLRAGKEGSGK